MHVTKVVLPNAVQLGQCRHQGLKPGAHQIGRVRSLYDGQEKLSNKTQGGGKQPDERLSRRRPTAARPGLGVTAVACPFSKAADNLFCRDQEQVWLQIGRTHSSTTLHPRRRAAHEFVTSAWNATSIARGPMESDDSSDVGRAFSTGPLHIAYTARNRISGTRA